MTEIPPEDAAPSTLLCPQISTQTPICLADHPALAATGTAALFAHGETILGADTPVGAIYELRSGTARVGMHTPDGKRQIIGFLGPGALIGSFTAGRLICSAEALGPVEATRFDRTTLEARAMADGSLALGIARALADQLSTLQMHVFRLGRLSAEERIAAFLLAQGPETDSRSAVRGPVVHLAMGRKDIADHLGLSVDTVSRVLLGLRRARVLAFGRMSVIRIRNPDRLAALASNQAKPHRHRSIRVHRRRATMVKSRSGR